MREFIEIELQMRKERLKFVLGKNNILHKLGEKRDEMYSKVNNKDFIKKEVSKEYKKYITKYYKDGKKLRDILK